jgi:hypothetical protein
MQHHFATAKPWRLHFITGWTKEVARIRVNWKQFMSTSKMRMSSFYRVSLFTMSSQPRMKNSLP